MRALYTLGVLYVALCGALLWAGRSSPSAGPVPAAPRRGCAPPPRGVGGGAYGAGFFALAGKIDRARELIAALDANERLRAANIVFDLADRKSTRLNSSHGYISYAV